MVVAGMAPHRTGDTEVQLWFTGWTGVIPSRVCFLCVCVLVLVLVLVLVCVCVCVCVCARAYVNVRIYVCWA